MPIIKEIESIYLEKEAVINILLALLSSNSSYISELEKTAQSIANQIEVSDNE